MFTHSFLTFLELYFLDINLPTGAALCVCK